MADGPGDRSRLAEDLASAEPWEKPFLEALHKAGGPEPLLRDLGLLRSDFEDQEEKAYAFYKAGPRYARSPRVRKSLVFRSELTIAGTRYWVLIYGRSDYRRANTLILTDSDFRVVSWRTAGVDWIYVEARLEPRESHYKLRVTFGRNMRRIPPTTEAVDFRVTSAGIYHYENPGEDPPHSGSLR